MPSKERIEGSNFKKYFAFLKSKYNLDFNTYDKLYAWSVSDMPTFWESIWHFCEIKASAYEQVMGEPKMPGTQWFRGARLSFAENLLRYRDDQLAFIDLGEDRKPRKMSYQELYLTVAKCAKAMKDIGVTKGDRVAGFMPNISETVIAMLAANSLGAIWSSCSPDFGTQAVLDRFGQIKPKVLFAPNGYLYNGKRFDCLEKIKKILKEIPSVKQVVVVNYLENTRTVPDRDSPGISWDELLNNDATEIEFAQLPFDHPLYIMFSSGTTGIPKCIVHGQGGTLIQHLKEHVLHTNLTRKDRICYITTCGWMMWNWLVSGLAVGSTLVLSEGSVAYPDLSVKWKQIETEKITVFGTSPKYIQVCANEGLIPKDICDLTHLKTILSTGAPLTKDNFEWVYKNVKSDDLQLSSISGGTDIISCFMLGNPLLPVYSEQIQCRGLGMKVEAFDDNQKPVVGKKGELVCTAPFPSMPVCFWNDEDQKKYKDAYFNDIEEVWRHGDYIELTKNEGVIVYGRSDSTLNPGGVRFGTAEIYRQVETLSEIKDSIVVGQNYKNDIRIVLFVVLSKGHILTDELIIKIKKTIKLGASPRHVPGVILEVKDIPYTMSAKKVELAVQKIIHNEPVKNKSAIVNAECLEQFKNRDELKS